MHKKKIDKNAVGRRIREIRFYKGLTLEAFGKLFGASKGNVQQWEDGISLPNKERLATISKIADMTVNELLYGSVDEFAKENYEKIIIDTYGSKNGIPIASTINKADFSRFIKDKKLANRLLNDIDDLIETIWDLSNEYIMDNRQRILTTEKGSYMISDDLYKLIQALKILESHKEKTNNNEQLNDTIKRFHKVINVLLEDEIESTPISDEILNKLNNKNI